MTELVGLIQFMTDAATKHPGLLSALDTATTSAIAIFLGFIRVEIRDIHRRLERIEKSLS